MTTTHFTYQSLVALVEGDAELITRMVDEGVIVMGAGDVAIVDVDVVLVTRTLWRDLAIDWPGIEVILRLRGELAAARARIAALEAALATRSDG